MPVFNISLRPALLALLAWAALAPVVLAPAALAQDHDLVPLGPDSPESVVCGDVAFRLDSGGTLRFPGWHFRSVEAVGPEDSFIICGQYLGDTGAPVGWICASETYTPVGVASAEHMCQAVDRLLSGQR